MEIIYLSSFLIIALLFIIYLECKTNLLWETNKLLIKTVENLIELIKEENI